ncbi:MAG TPA: hypothetical protein VF026_23135 [Ktedonobacteraceae bacterium]
MQCAFRVGLPAIDAFPRKLWQQLLVRSWRQMSPELLAYHHAAGYLPLREAIASQGTSACLSSSFLWTVFLEMEHNHWCEDMTILEGGARDEDARGWI